MQPLNAGVSGTQHGCTEKQAICLIYLVSQVADSVDFFHHGDCIGVDTEFHELVRKMVPDSKIVVHPPTIDDKRSFCKGDFERAPLPYLERDKKIVAESDIMFIVPQQKEEQLRSGTWATYRYAIKAKKPVFLIYPDGKYKKILPKK